MTKTSLADLRQKCLDLREDTQKQFSIKVNCAGSYTVWESEAGETKLQNLVDYNATSTKMGRFETQRRVHSVEVDSSAQCKVWKKVRIGSPEGIGIPIAITDCDER